MEGKFICSSDLFPFLGKEALVKSRSNVEIKGRVALIRVAITKDEEIMQCGTSLKASAFSLRFKFKRLFSKFKRTFYNIVLWLRRVVCHACLLHDR